MCIIVISYMFMLFIWNFYTDARTHSLDPYIRLSNIEL